MKNNRKTVKTWKLTKKIKPQKKKIIKTKTAKIITKSNKK